MSFELTSERLQDIAVGCVTQFMNKQASLSEAIAKEVQELELNADQTKRVIEASNTIAYLRQLEKSADRTFEFDVADYNKVMGAMCLPDEMAKEAGTPPWLDKDKDSKEDSKEDDKGEKKDKEDSDDKDEKKHRGEDFGKKDEDRDGKEGDGDKDDEEEDSDERKQEKKAMLKQAYFQARAELKEMDYAEADLYMEISKTASLLGKDVLAMEKIAFVVDIQDVDKTLRLCGLEKRAQDDLVFTDSDLLQTRKVYSLLKKAEDFIVKKAELGNFIKRAEEVLFKQAVVGLVGRGVGTIAGSVVKNTANVAGHTIKNIGSGKIGLNTILTGTAGMTINHKNNVRDI